LLFEALILTYAAHMPVAAVGRMVREHDTRIWRVAEHYVAQARAGLDFSAVTEVGVDETSARRGHDYVSIFMGLFGRRVLFATGGRGVVTVKRFAEDLAAHGGDPQRQIERACCDMSPAFISGIKSCLSQSGGGADEAAVTDRHRPQVVFGKYHVIAVASEDLDAVRRAEVKTRPELKGTRCT